MELVYKHPTISPKDFRKVSHPEPKILNSSVNCPQTLRQTDVTRSRSDPTSSGVSTRFTHVRACMCLSVYSWLDCLISFVLEDRPFWNLLEKFLRCSYISSKYFQICCMSVSLLFGLLHNKNLTNINLYPVLGEKSFWIFQIHSWDAATLIPNSSEFLVCLSLC